MSTALLDFSDIADIQVEVKVKSETYILREASGAAAAKYRSAAASCMKMVDGKTVGVTGIGEVESLLVSLCLFDANDRPVHRDIITTWPARVVKAIFVKAKEISGLDEDSSLDSLKQQRDLLDKQIKALETDALGNESSSTPDGST